MYEVVLTYTLINHNSKYLFGILTFKPNNRTSLRWFNLLLIFTQILTPLFKKTLLTFAIYK